MGQPPLRRPFSRVLDQRLRKRETMGKSKLLKLKNWLTVPEAARHLSILFEEEVNEADVLRFALDDHLTLSVYFVNEVSARCGRLITYEDEEALPTELQSALADLPEESRKGVLEGIKNFGWFGEHYAHLDKEITTVDGVWDIPMVAGLQHIIENEYQKLSGGPEAETRIIGAAYFVRGDGEVCRLYEEFDDPLVVKTKEGEKIIDFENKSDRYYPSVAHLPDDSMLVVRTRALLDLLERLNEEPTIAQKNPRTEKSNLHIIGAMLDIVMEKKLFNSEEGLRKHIAEKYAGFAGCTERTLGGRFAEAKKLLSE